MKISIIELEKSNYLIFFFTAKKNFPEAKTSTTEKSKK